MPPSPPPALGIILGQDLQPRKHEFTPSPRARLTPHPPPRKAPLPPDPDPPHVKVIDQLERFYDSDKVRGQLLTFNITTLATITGVPYQAALDVVLAFLAFELCKFDHPPHGLVLIRPEHREAFRFFEEEDYRALANLMGQVVDGKAPWQEGRPA